jgi:hypothetical protein
MSEIYRRFAIDYPRADFSEQAAAEMYLHESTGAALLDPKTNGFSLGKHVMDITVSGWLDEIPQGGLLVSELLADGYPQWFLERVGVLRLSPTEEACAWWRCAP